LAQIAFLHVGSDATQPMILCRSLKANNPEIRIIQCSDQATSPVDGVSEVARFDGDTERLMLFRTSAYARLTISEPTLFLDTDMICLEPLDPSGALLDGMAAVCLREYGRDMLLYPDAMGVDLSEYQGRTLGDVYPYIGCAIVCRSNDFWYECLQEMGRLPPKFQRWFGDQEALRNVVDARLDSVRWLPESIYACLADVETDRTKRPKICHFKGPARKQMMLDFAKAIGLWP
jgi:hypothetical protein